MGRTALALESSAARRGSARREAGVLTRGAPTTIGRAVVEASRGERAALFLGLLAAFVAAVEAIDRIRLD
ncbi:MAG TPA: hypothetical protein VMN82_08405, partial [Thermoanaerobaculia bacterium]|nr:hypothetical protein [Thermoanaerobaculia bacterium]